MGNKQTGTLIDVRSISGYPGKNILMSLADGQTNAGGTTYVSQSNSVYKDGGEVRPANFTVRVWRRSA